ncbi:MAG: nuclear transport factor 2 family protein [Cyclobacteriaceae bacterium]
MKATTALPFILLSLLGCNQQNVDTRTEGEKLMQVSREWSQSASSGDVEKILGYWADDAVVISAGQPVLRGKDQIRKMVEDGFSSPGFKISWEPKSAVISSSGDLGYLLEETKITMNDSTGNAVTNFQSVTIWKKGADGSWKNVVDVMSPAP